MNLYTILAIHIVTTLLNVFFVYPYCIKNNKVMYKLEDLFLLIIPILSQVSLCILVGTIIKDWFETKDTVIEVVYKKYLKWFGVDV